MSDEFGWFRGNVRRVVRDGKKTRFWYDCWLGETPLKSRYNRLFLMSVQQNALVDEMGEWMDNLGVLGGWDTLQCCIGVLGNILKVFWGMEEKKEIKLRLTVLWFAIVSIIWELQPSAPLQSPNRGTPKTPENKNINKISCCFCCYSSREILVPIDLRKMDSDLQQQSQQVNSSGLTRNRSAPSSLFTNIIDREFYEHIFNRPSSPETERVFSRFMSSLSEEDSLNQRFSTDSSAVIKEEINHEGVLQQSSVSIDNNYSSNSNNCDNSVSRDFYQSSNTIAPLPNQNVYSIGVNELKSGSGGNNSTLIRHSSSPAGLFSQINIENGFCGMRGLETLGAVNKSIEGAKFSNSRRFKNASSYSSGRMSSIAEIGDKGRSSENNPHTEAFADTYGNDFITDYQVGPWDDSAMMSDNVGGLKRFRENDAKTFSGLNAAETQNETGQAPAPLAHHLSLPNTSAEMAAIEKFLQFSDSVPCKIRAKRGCATHPRSVAERVRRTKISERMRKLQDLVPNMDKQTNTADMLDLAVDYIKDLQKQVKTLTDRHGKCTCSNEKQQ
ncbi:hypothetical protein RJT34_28374 [Clitoria ternatea]|uniref:BHLH domain-containing protein n=1 Tax=Clitoria ternatea TaxID=43366 RepID=A0AAN9FHK2_CLITE